jgi:hypothetical protein
VGQLAEEVGPSDLRRVKGRSGGRIGSAAAIRRSQVELFQAGIAQALTLANIEYASQSFSGIDAERAPSLGHEIAH